MQMGDAARCYGAYDLMEGIRPARRLESFTVHPITIPRRVELDIKKRTVTLNIKVRKRSTVGHSHLHWKKNWGASENMCTRERDTLTFELKPLLVLWPNFLRTWHDAKGLHVPKHPLEHLRSLTGFSGD